MTVRPLSGLPRAQRLAAWLAPAPARAVQLAVATMLRDGHFLRHLRKMKRLYRARREALLARVPGGVPAALGVLLELPAGVDDLGLARRARGIAPVPLSPWYAGRSRAGLLLGVSTVTPQRLDEACRRLEALWAKG